MNNRKIIAVSDDNFYFEESLPLPWVGYPSIYGTFITFKLTKISTPYYCSCCKAALLNYLGVSFFTEDNILFKNNLCHVCNVVIPDGQYCHKMYAGIFKQTFGWYLNQRKYQYGIIGSTILPNQLPDGVRQIIATSSDEFKLTNIGFYGDDEFQLSYRWDHDVFTKRLNRFIENDVRKNVGFKPVGSGQINERILLLIVRCYFPNENILYRKRPAFLKGLELDIYMPNLALAIEYQGQQHYKPVKHWGGCKALNDLKKRDRRKVYLCKKNNIKLIKFYHKEVITYSLVRLKLASFINTHK